MDIVVFLDFYVLLLAILYRFSFLTVAYITVASLARLNKYITKQEDLLPLHFSII